jgi:hypothetical protein
MKTLACLILAGLIVAPAVLAAPLSPDDNQAKYQAKYEAKLELEFIEYGGWITDFDEAMAKAKREDKVLFTYFSRSYAP